MTSYGFRVFGTPSPQGSKIPGVSSKTGKMFVREQNKKKVDNWRLDVREAALTARGCDPKTGDPLEGVTPIMTFGGACAVQIQFLVVRPASVSVAKRPHPSVKPDLDKMIRATLDAMKEAGVYKDDGQVVKIWAVKSYGGDDPQSAPGAFITVSEVLGDRLNL